MPRGEGYSDPPQIHQKAAGTLLHMNSEELLAGFQESPASETNIKTFSYICNLGHQEKDKINTKSFSIKKILK